MRSHTLCLSITLAASTAGAQSACFTPLAPGARPSTHHVVGPGARFEPSPGCRYDLRRRGAEAVAPSQALAAGPRDVAEFARDLRAPADALAADLEVAARSESDGHVETLSLRPCITGLGEGSTVVRFEPQGASVRVQSTAAPDRCPVADAELVLAPDRVRDTVLTATPDGSRVLSLTTAAREDFGPGAWSVYARRRGSTAALRVDRVRFGDARTALQQRFAAPGEQPWFRADWSHGALRLSPAGAGFTADDLAWSELASAAATQAVFFAGPDATDGADGAAVHPLPLDVDGASAQVPGDVVRDAMRARYGTVGSSLVPAASDWRRVLGALRVCHRGRYEPSPVRSARVTPAQVAAMHCLPLAQITAAPAAEAIAPLTIERHLDLLQRRDGVTVAQSPDATPEPLALERESSVRFVTPGDVLRAPATLPAGRVLSLCPASSDRGDREAVTLAAGATHTFSESSEGLWQVVLRPAGEPRCTAQDLALARVAVVVPRTSWIPAGLQAHGAMDLHDPWKGLETAGDDTFAFQSRTGVPEFRFAAPNDVAAAINGWQPDAQGETVEAAPRIARTIPVRLRAEPAITSPAASALVVLLSDDEACPASADALRSNLRGLPSEATLHAFLAVEHPDGSPRRFTCLARARLRVTPPLVHRGSDAGPFFVRWGVPGSISLRAHFEVVGECNRADCLSLGVAMPLIYARISPRAHGASWVGMEFSVPVVLAASPGDGRALHTGLGLDVSFTLGPHALPRLVSLGVMMQPAVLAVHPAASNASVNVAPYLGVNLSSIFDAIRSE